MRILHLIPQLSGGGAERQLTLLAPEMAKAGHDVHIAYLREGPEPALIPNVALHRTPAFHNHDPLMFFRLLRHVKAIRPQIVQSWIPMMDIMAGFLSFSSKIKWVLREPTSALAYKTRTFKIKIRETLAQRSSAIVANSNGGRDYWVKAGYPQDRTFVINNAVPFDGTRNVNPWPIRNNHAKYFMYAGRLIPSKNVNILIDAISSLCQHTNIILLVAGNGPEKSNLSQLVARFGIKDRVKFLGHLQPQELWSYMKIADGFVSLSSYEGMPNSCGEAVALKIPMVLSDIPAHRALFDDESAFFVDPRSAVNVANTVWQVSSDRPEAEKRAAIAFEIIKDWTPASIASNYLHVYEKLTSDGNVHSRTY